MKILVLNVGSSSIKFKVFRTQKCKEEMSGIIDGIFQKKCSIRIKANGITTENISKIANHIKAMDKIREILEKHDINNIQIVGHRVVHGGEIFTKTTKISKEFIKELSKISHLAPLHNPANLIGIKEAEKIFKTATHFAVFDTAFHSTMPEIAYKYALPNSVTKKFSIRKYGFHGTSHSYVCKKAAKIIGKKNCNLISCHLGNGNSITAVKNGKSIDTTMGFTPLEGLPMGTRSGSIDPAIVSFLEKNTKLSIEKIDEILNKKSGLLAISELSSDMRLIWAEAQKHNSKAIIAIEILAYNLAKYIASYIAVLGGVDGLIFTGGIGENAWYVREKCLNYLKIFNIYLHKKNNKNAHNLDSFKIVSTNNSKAKIFVIPTNEELEIANQCLKNY